MTAIMDAFTQPTLRLTLEEVAARTRLPRSTTHRILDQLVRLGWVERTSNGYALGHRALGLGGRHGDGDTPVRRAAAPALHELQVRTGLVVHLSVLEGSDIVYLDKLGGRAAATVPSRVGERAPAHTTAGGKAILAMLPPAEAEELLRGRLSRRTPRTISDLATLRQELHRIRQRHGLAFERGESVPGVACVAAPVRGVDGPVASISLCGELDAAQLEGLAPLVVSAAREAGLGLSPSDGEPGPTCPDATEQHWSPETFDRLLATAQRGDWI